MNKACSDINLNYVTAPPSLPKMEKMQFFIKYQNNQPVKIKTHFMGGGQKRSDPLTDVGTWWLHTGLQ